MIDFYASADHYMAHLMPVYQAMPAEFPSNITAAYGLLQDGKQIPDPIVCSAWTDAEQCQKLGRPLILMEHGAGQTYAGCKLPNYLNGEGRQILSGIMVVNPDQVKQSEAVAPKVPVEAVGCPRLATLAQIPLRGLDPMGQKTLVLAFRWDTELHFGGTNKAIAEARSAWDHWASQLPAFIQALDPQWKVLIHFHPRIAEQRKAQVQGLLPGVEFSEDQVVCLGRATIWAQDNSSALWEACALGVPVVHLNAPWYRKKAQHGLRFWRWTCTGPVVSTAQELMLAIDTLQDAKAGAEFTAAREEFAREWFGYDPTDPTLGAIRAAEVLTQWFPSIQAAPAREQPQADGEAVILMETRGAYRLIAEGEFWQGDRFAAGWRHERQGREIVPVRKLGHLDPRARAGELENLGIAIRVG